ncbi:Fusarisetin A cluster transcription factor fsa6-like protein [Cladobotryum mycophilum]|uniref:Fusarisetin A cluster transcription factor fsa6-like protein n=1 Tax=Cladobotryum mycophilum TaxID=491253 RepID=A0ABR0SMF8_9HYPO
MEPDTSPDTVPKKRTRVLLSCGPCRASKLKCDREQPCVQCSKKGRIDLCVYAPKPERKRPITKGMAARLKRLEGMVRGMMDDQGNPGSQGQVIGSNVAPPLRGQVIHGDRAITYVGATHCLAMLEDIEDIKAYFDDPESSEDENSPHDEFETPDMLPFYRAGSPRNREELVAQLPGKHVADRLVTRYFSARSPSQHIIHRPTFTKAYTRFWQDHNANSLHWLSQLFMIFALGIFYNNYSAPAELTADSPIPVKDRIKQYRSCAAWALIAGKYAQPTSETIPAFILYVESDFILNRAAQMNCYILSGVCLRLMLKMGYHRDPSKLANISPFESEMRRRQWNMAVQVDTLVSFHMGLPSLSGGIESDTDLPRNLDDSDFDPSCTELPPARPDTYYTFMSYAINKSRLLKVFAKIAQQAHCLTSPTYSDVLGLDNLLNETWKTVPTYLHVRPLDESIGDPPHQIIQRFGLASLHHKSICVLHRRYLAEPIPKREHDYSRQQCLESATALLEFQHSTWEGCKPGNVLGPSGWFMSSLAVHDFMLAAMILYVIIQSENYVDDGTGFGLASELPAPTKDELKRLVRRSYDISSQVFNTMTDLRKTAYTLAIMLDRLGCPVDSTPSVLDSFSGHNGTPSEVPGTNSNVSISPAGNGPDALLTNEFQALHTSPKPTTFPTMDQNLTSMGDMDISMPNIDLSWMLSAENLDWRHLDASIGQGTFLGGASSEETQLGTESLSLDMDMMTGELWNMPSAGDGHGN